ncbi:MAG: hypothetical protein WAN74_01530 [Thermoplasmata archaeon]
MKRRKRTLGPWELSHKTYSFRAPPELVERVEALRKKKPLQEIVLKGLGLVGIEANAYDKGLTDGDRIGYERGKAEWDGLVRLPCHRCGEAGTINVIREPNLLNFLPWTHVACLKPGEGSTGIFRRTKSEVPPVGSTPRPAPKLEFNSSASGTDRQLCIDLDAVALPIRTGFAELHGYYRPVLQKAVDLMEKHIAEDSELFERLKPIVADIRSIAADLVKTAGATEA